MWGAITGFFSSSKSTEKVVDGVISGVDKMFFTDEEKSDAYKKILDWRLAMTKATQSQSPARRAIAVIVTGLWAFLILVGVIAQSWGSTDFAKYVFDTIKENIHDPFAIIIAFYFLTHVVKGLGKRG